MTDLETQIAKTLPGLPPRVVIRAIQMGASSRDLLLAASLSGQAQARAKTYLPRLRQAVISQLHQPHDDLRTQALAILAMSPSTRFSEAEGTRLRSLRIGLADNKREIGLLCRQQSTMRIHLAGTNQRLNRATSSKMLGTAPLKSLGRAHNDLIQDMRTAFLDLLALTKLRSRILIQVTEIVDRFLFLAGCDVSEIHSAGGTSRTLRAIYKRTARLSHSQPHKKTDQILTDCKALLERVSHYEERTAVLRHSIRRDLETLQRPPGQTTLPAPDSAAAYSWPAPYWLNLLPDSSIHCTAQ